MTTAVRRGERVSLGFGAALLAALTAGAAPEPAPSASNAPAPSASAPAAPVLPAPWGAEIPSTVSKPPSKAEWAAAKQVRMHRGGLGPCSAHLVREWLRLRCTNFTGAGLIAGDPTGVVIEAYGDPLSGGTTLVTVQLPVRRGEAKILGFTSLAWTGYDGISFEEAGTLSVQWRAGREDPLLVMHGTWSRPADFTPR